MNIYFRFPSKDLHYQIEIKSYNRSLNSKRNVITYDEHISPKKETVKGFVINIKRSNALLNNSKDQEPINEILFITAKVLEDLVLEISNKGEILKVKNLIEIQKYWKEIRFKIESTYIGDIVTKIIKPMELAIMDEKALIRALDKDPFFHYYFNETSYNYPDNKFNINNLSNNFLLNKQLIIQSKGTVEEHENGDKQLKIVQRFDSSDLDFLKEKMKVQQGDGILDVEMNNTYLISTEQYIKLIEINQGINWNKQLIKSMNMNVKLVSQ